MRRSLTVLLSLGLVLGLGAIRSLVAQDEEPAPAPSPAATTPEAPREAQDEAEETTPADADVDAGTAPDAEATDDAGDLPPEVREKREAALKAVAELIVAAEQAGLVQTNVDPPPVLEILILGRATDKADLEAASSNPEAQVGLINPEAFAAYFTGYAEPPEGLTAQDNIRIRQPSEGLKEFFDRRAEALRPYLDAARDGSSPEPADDDPAEPTADDPAEPAAVPVSPEPAEPAEQPKDEPKAETPPEEPKAEEPAPEEPEEEPKAETPADEPEAEQPPEEPKAEEPTADEPRG